TVTYNSIETFNATGATVDLSFSATQDGTPDTFRLVRSGANLQVTVDGTLAFNGAVSGVHSVTVNGSGDDDTLTVDNSGGILHFPTTFPAGGGVNHLTLPGNPGAPVSHEPSTVPGPAAGNFVLDPDGTPGNGDEETVSFTGLADTSDTKPATTFDVFLTAGSDLVQIADGSPAGTTRIGDLGSTFAGVTFANTTNVRIPGPAA